MDYIHRYDNNYYKPSGSLQRLFNELIVQPFEDHQPTTAWENHVRSRNSEYHRKTILKQGSANFSEGFEGLTPEDVVLLYCYHYLPMHLFSSYHIFTKYLSPMSDKVIFIDFGCGPLTSGIAFWAAFAEHCDITYIGIDSSSTMLNKAREINQHGPLTDILGIPFYENTYLISDHKQLPQLVDRIQMDIANTLIIFNFCYFLQSQTFSNSLNTEILGTLLAEFGIYAGRVCAVYQDPVGTKFQERWHYLKSWAIPYPSTFNESGFGWQDPTEVIHAKYDTLWGEHRQVAVSYDSFNNLSYFDTMG